MWNGRPPRSYTAMMMAAVGGYYYIVQLLLEHGANPGVKNYIGDDFLKRKKYCLDR